MDHSVYRHLADCVGTYIDGGVVVAHGADRPVLIVMRSLVGYERSIEPELIFVCGGEYAASLSHKGIEETGIQVGFAFDEAGLNLRDIHKHGDMTDPVAWGIENISGGGTNDPPMWRGVARLQVEPYPPAGAIILGVSWKDAGINQTTIRLSVPPREEIATRLGSLV